MLDGPPTAGDKLLLLFDNNSERLLRCREKLIRRFAIEFCDAEDLASETFKRVLHALERDETQLTTSIEAYVSGFATKIIYEARKQVSRKEIPLDDLPAAKEPRSTSPEELLIACSEEEGLRQCWQQCLDELHSSDREMLVRYYDLELGKKLKAVRDEVARSLGLTNAQLRKRTFNLRKELEACIKYCLARRNRI